MIKISNLNKYYENIKVLSDVNIHIEKGEIFGIIGHSGAGKSTLLRCINRLEDYEDGSILVEEKEVKDLSENELRFLRKDLGMIFQHFSLLERKTVFENVALPLECFKYSKAEKNKRVNELLELVGIADKKNQKPRNLSGGQKQRVAIARALVLNPKILLCDEATSALDPQITRDILNLLLKINKEMNITIVVVTHQMEVIKQICNKVAFLKDGRVLSVGKPEELFVAPNQEIQKFVGDDIEILPQTGKNIKLFFTNNNSKSHTITQLARTLDINFDICQGKLENFRGSMMGSLIINIDEKDLQAVGNYLDQEKITWEEIV